VQKRVAAVASGFFAPIFFVSIGLHLDLGVLLEVPVFATTLVIVAVLSKLAGAGVPARLMGLGNREAMAVGVGMSSRGAVELVIADVARRAGLFELPVPTPTVVQETFSAVVFMAVATTIITPFGLRAVFRGSDPRLPPDSDAYVSYGKRDSPRSS
jgi:Kef-type K+ transport system membrane component KefB